MAAGVLDAPLSTDEVDRTGERIAREFSAYLTAIIQKIGEAI